MKIHDFLSNFVKEVEKGRTRGPSRFSPLAANGEPYLQFAIEGTELDKVYELSLKEVKKLKGQHVFWRRRPQLDVFGGSYRFTARLLVSDKPADLAVIEGLSADERSFNPT